MENLETFHSIPLDTLAHIFDDEVSVSHDEFPRATILPEGPQITSSKYFDEDQKSSGSCVPHAIGTAIEIKLDKMNKQPEGTEHLSRMFWYRQRSNWPYPGSSPYEIVKLAEIKGWLKWDELPTPATEQLATELVITPEMKLSANINATGYTVKANPLAYTEKALINAVMSGEPVCLTFVSSIREWRQEYVDILEENFDHKTAAVCHEQVIMPNSAFIKNGKTYFTTAESAHINGLDHHHFSWDFLSKRMYNPFIVSVAIAPPVPVYPVYYFSTNLYKEILSPDVPALQKALVADGVMEEPKQYGYFGTLTFNAVRKFQKKHGIAATGFVGPLTRGKLNELCSIQKTTT